MFALLGLPWRQWSSYWVGLTFSLGGGLAGAEGVDAVGVLGVAPRDWARQLSAAAGVIPGLEPDVAQLSKSMK